LERRPLPQMKRCGVVGILSRRDQEALPTQLDLEQISIIFEIESKRLRAETYQRQEHLQTGPFRGLAAWLSIGKKG
jgi:hypothetical protein